MKTGGQQPETCYLWDFTLTTLHDNINCHLDCTNKGVCIRHLGVTGYYGSLMSKPVH